MYARYTTMEGYLSIRYVCQSIATLRAQYKQRKRDKNHSLPIFAIGVRAYSSIALSSIGYSGERKKKKKEKKKIIRRTGKCLMVFGSIHVRPTRERNLESVSSGPVGKTSLHISYVGVHSCASILTSSLSTRFLHSSMLATV